jgi:hypothetical protein
MLAISDDEQQSYRAKSWLPKGLRRRRARTSLQLPTDVRHRWRRCASSSLRWRSQRGPRDFCHGLLGMPEFCEGAVMKQTVAVLAALFCACGVRAQTPSTLKEGTVYNRPVYFVANDKLEVAVVRQGGSMLRILIQGDTQGLSPYGNPEMVPSVPDNRKLQGPMVGHFVCVDGFGDPSREERAAGLAMHGEAYLQPWKLEGSEKQGATTTVKFSANLPLREEAFTRVLRMVDGESVIYVDSELESKTAFDRTANWGEHPYLFPPFLEREHTVVDMSGTRSQTRTYPVNPGNPGGRAIQGGQGAAAGQAGQAGRGGLAGRGGRGLSQGKDFTWPMAPDPDGKPLDVRAAPATGSWMAHTTTLMDPSRQLAFITVLNTARHYLLGYVFRREEFPWVQNYLAYTPDWIGRGVEFATQPFDLPHRDMVELNRMFDTPVYRWLPAKSKISTRFLLFWVKSPEGMTRVDDVRLDNGKLIVEDRVAGKTLTLAASLPL